MESLALRRGVSYKDIACDNFLVVKLEGFSSALDAPCRWCGTAAAFNLNLRGPAAQAPSSATTFAIV